ncbi:MAG: GumC family protein [Syntrophobacteraceae bacterium]
MSDIATRYDIQETSMRDFYNILFRHKRQMSIFWLCVMTIVGIGVFIGPRLYESQAQMLVRIGRENATVGPTVVTGKVININADRESEINSEVDILRSRELAEEVVDRIGAQRVLNGEKETLPVGAPLPAELRFWARRTLGYPFRVLAGLLCSGSSSTVAGRMLERELAILSFMKRLDVEAPKKSNMITVAYRANDPALAQRILERFLGFYLEKHIEVNRTPGSYSFFKRQRDQLRASLARTEEALKSLKNRTGVASVSEQRHILLERIAAMKSELEGIESSAGGAQAKVADLGATLARLPGTVRIGETRGFANSAADELRKQVYQLELEEQKLLSIYTETSVPVQTIRRRLKRAKALLLRAREQTQSTTGVNENYQKVQFELLTEKGHFASLLAKSRTLGTQLKDARIQLQALNEAEMRFEQLDRDLATQRANYLKYSESLEQARIDEALDMQRISNISIVEPATYSIQPVAPKTFLILALGMFLAISGAFGIAFLCDFQDHSIKEPKDIANRLRLPMLATLPEVFPERVLRDGRLRGQAILLEQTSCDWILGSNAHRSAMGELLRVCTNVHGAIGLVGCHGGEGVSTAASLLCRQLAKQHEGRVLLIDANLARPDQHNRFGAKPSPGLTDFGSSQGPNTSCIQPANVDNLDILSAGSGAEDFTAQAFRAFCEVFPSLRQEYGFVICDLPPLLKHNSARSIVAMMDGVVMVVESEKTRWEVADIVREALARGKTDILGVVLNKRRFHIPKWLYKRL